MAKILSRVYFTATAPPFNWPVLIVARAGGMDDWAAYISGVGHLNEPSPEDEQHVADIGVKLTEPQARAFFPDITRAYRP